VQLNNFFLRKIKSYPLLKIAELANIWYEVLGKIWMPNLSIAYIEQLIGEWKDHTDKLPLAHVAMHHTKPIGGPLYKYIVWP
jgi:hypothetical protein